MDFGDNYVTWMSYISTTGFFYLSILRFGTILDCLVLGDASSDGGTHGLTLDATFTIIRESRRRELHYLAITRSFCSCLVLRSVSLSE
ncbi:hypothetical protein M413DRAFT_180760 [Hebeloma cylindrosporum]|uniref:Uncharacterized protein n=1 Tax=Hebeloma cylindrosporum TaxID=76867 RepID=A0A0C2YFA7_HEBCY|nr:hypothetical protein M413DRAFT_180760 [Hebeloma cylindrosporum h7]